LQTPEPDIEVSMGASWEPSEALTAELRRVRVTAGAAGPARGVQTFILGEVVSVVGPLGEQPRRRWRGSEAQLLELLGRLPDAAGVDPFWALLEA
jgi:hypothetical protein